MQQIRLILLAALFLVMVTACGSDASTTPTPFPSAAPTFRASTGDPIPVPITDLAANPGFYENAYIRLSGQFDRLPRLVCGGRLYKSPANWGIVSNDFLARAAGFEDQIFPLTQRGLTMTLVGYWRQWKGPVGCGKLAVPSTIWYLEVSQVLSPSPLVRATFTPEGGSGDVIAEITPETPNPNDAGSTATAVPPTDPTDDEPFSTAVATPTTTNSLATPTSSSDLTATAAPGAATTTPTSSNNLTATATPTTFASSGTATATATTGSNSGSSTATTTPIPTNTPTSSNPNQPTATPGSALATSTPPPQLINQGSINPEELAVEQLATGEYHVWTFTAVDNDTITVYLASQDTIDGSITIRDAANNALTTRNAASSGGIESILNFAIASAGTYQIEIRTENGGSGGYALMFLDKDAYDFVLTGILTYGTMRTDALPADTDHFWHFSGTAGDTITITVAPQDSSDVFFELYGPNAQNLTDFVDDGVAGETETLAAYSLPTTGFYSIRIGEFDFMAASFQITVTKQ